jgi:transcriptional regulator with XRE-family HTH domain
VKESVEISARVEFGKQLKAYRTAAGISQDRLAKAMMMQQSYIGYIEKAETGIGIDKMAEISSCFGLKYYDFANPQFPIPSKNSLRENLRIYLISKNIDPSYLDDEEAPNYAKNMDIYLGTNKLEEPKTSYEIAQDYKIMFDEHIEPSKVTDILTKAPRNKMVDVKKPEVGRGNLYQLRKKKNGH